METLNRNVLNRVAEVMMLVKSKS